MTDYETPLLLVGAFVSLVVSPSFIGIVSLVGIAVN